MMIKICLVVILLAPLAQSLAPRPPVRGSYKNDTTAEFINRFFLEIIPKFFRQPAFNENGTYSQYERFATLDQSNEDISTANAQKIITRSGYRYENHYVLARDGYITQLIRIVNPLVERIHLRQPPVMLFHGGIINPTAYLVASAIQHHPERYPRLPGQMHTSWNRSLAFTLSNNGYDVWLVGTRGSTRQNQGHTRLKVFQPKGLPLFEGEDVDKDASSLMRDRELRETFNYWDYSMDEVQQHEVTGQLSKVLEVTGAKNVTAFTFSLSTMFVPTVLSSNRKFASKIHNLVLMAPIINNKGVNVLIGAIHNVFAHFEYKLGTIIWSALLTGEPFRHMILTFGLPRDLRYTIVKGFSGYLCGSSGKFFTNLEGPVIGHIFEPISFKEIQHYCQQVLAGRLQKFDYGPIENQLRYKSLKPPSYDISNLHVNHWLLVSAENDNLATPASIRQILREVKQPPEQHIIYRRANHLDLIAGFENDRHVNLPVLRFLNDHNLPPLSEPLPVISLAEREKQKRLAALVPAVTLDHW